MVHRPKKAARPHHQRGEVALHELELDGRGEARVPFRAIELGAGLLADTVTPGQRVRCSIPVSQVEVL